MPEPVTSESSCRIGVIATDPLRGVGLLAILAQEPGVAPVLLTPATLPEAEGLEMVVMDALAVDNLFAALAMLRRSKPRVHVLVLGPQTDTPHVTRVLSAGAQGYVPYTVSEQELLDAVDAVRAGVLWTPLEIAGQKTSSAGCADVHLTHREAEVLELLTNGQPNRVIAARLGVDEGTVKAHLGRLMRKAGVNNRTALSMWATRSRHETQHHS